ATWPLGKSVRTWDARCTIVPPPGGFTVHATKGFLTPKTGGSWLVHRRGHYRASRWKEGGQSYGPWAKRHNIRTPTARRAHPTDGAHLHRHGVPGEPDRRAVSAADRGP